MPPTKEKVFEALNFTRVHENNKYGSYCNVCGKKLCNTATSRLQAHRRICKLDSEIQLLIAEPEISFSSTVNNTPQLESSFCGKISNVGGSSTIDHNSYTVQNDEQQMDIVSELIINPYGSVVDENPLELSEPESTSDTMIVCVPDVPSKSSFPSRKMLKITSTPNNIKGRSLDTTPNNRKGHSLDTTPNNRKGHSLDTTPNNRKAQSLDNYVDDLSNDDIEELNSKLSNFIYGCNIPFSVVESDHFKNFIAALCPSMVEHLPGRKELSTYLLDRKYRECIALCKEKVTTESILIVNECKNTSGNMKTIVTMLHNIGGFQVYVDACDVSEEQETGDELNEIIHNSISKAKSVYNTDIYAVVSGNASDMLETAGTMSIWHSNCSSFVGNLLLDDVMDETINKKVQSVLEEFKCNNFENVLLDQGSSKIKSPCDLQWGSYLDSYNYLIKNLQFMKNLVTTERKFKKIKTNIILHLFDDDFIEEVKQNIILLNPIYKLLNTCQDPNTSIADAADLWLNLELPPKCSKFEDHLEHRRDMALNIYVLTAYWLHPKYYDKARLLSQERIQKVREFLVQELDVEGLQSLQEFEEKLGIFQTLFKKVNSNGLLFWNLAKIHHKQLSQLSIKLLRIPASSAQIEQLFPNQSDIHSSVRSRLDSERSEKFLHIYYTLKAIDTYKSDEY